MTKLYQRKKLSDMTNVGEPAPLPSQLVGWPDSALADVSETAPAYATATGFAGAGFFPYTPPSPPQPTVIRRIPTIDFMLRLSPQTRVGIRSAAKTNPYVEDFLKIMESVDYVELDNPSTIEGVQLLISAQLLTQAEATALLA